MSENEIYNISFTAGAAMLVETHAVAEVLIECDGDWNKVKDRVFAENIMQKDKKSSTVRYYALIKQRLEVLTPEELRLLSENPADLISRFSLEVYSDPVDAAFKALGIR